MKNRYLFKIETGEEQEKGVIAVIDWRVVRERLLWENVLLLAVLLVVTLVPMFLLKWWLGVYPPADLIFCWIGFWFLMYGFEVLLDFPESYQKARTDLYWREYRCFGCGYQLTGLTINRCPECGKNFEGWMY